MKRRKFLRNTAMGATLPFWMQHCTSPSESIPIQFASDRQAGHLVFESLNWPQVAGDSYDLVIVGGGVSGLAAAAASQDKNFVLYELSDRLGGSSSSVNAGDFQLCQGAHYDLDYPEGYGEEVLLLLEKLGLIAYQPWKKAWSFVERQHIIPHHRRQQCYDHGTFRGDVIPEGADKSTFLEIIQSYAGEMHLPTRLISEELRVLNDVTFLEFLRDRMAVSADFERQLDYHMMDDYGGTTAQVSALAGIHYFMCRPYYLKPVDLFSPPEGNDYFVKRLASTAPESRIKTQHLVRRIEETPNGFEVEVVDIVKQKVSVVQAEKVIYAGHKHALEHVFPTDHTYFKDNTYAPWMIVNLVCSQQEGDYGYWQNEFLGEEKSYLGFVDSSLQDQESLRGTRVLTSYYCLRPEDRQYLAEISDNQQQIVTETATRVRKILKSSPKFRQAYIKVMGHAMPIPVPGYLFNDANEKGSRLIHAGVDNGRLPLLFEALDAGLLAAARV